MALRPDDDNILGHPLKLELSCSTFLTCHPILSGALPILSAALLIGFLHLLDFYLQRRELNKRLWYRRRFGIPDTDNRVFEVAYGAVRRKKMAEEALQSSTESKTPMTAHVGQLLLPPPQASQDSIKHAIPSCRHAPCTRITQSRGVHFRSRVSVIPQSNGRNNLRECPTLIRPNDWASIDSEPYEASFSFSKVGPAPAYLDFRERRINRPVDNSPRHSPAHICPIQRDDLPQASQPHARGSKRKDTHDGTDSQLNELKRRRTMSAKCSPPKTVDNMVSIDSMTIIRETVVPSKSKSCNVDKSTGPGVSRLKFCPDTGHRLRLVLVKKEQGRQFVLISDASSTTPALLPIFQEKWLTDQEYLDAKSRGLLLQCDAEKACSGKHLIHVAPSSKKARRLSRRTLKTLKDTTNQSENFSMLSSTKLRAKLDRLTKQEKQTLEALGLRRLRQVATKGRSSIPPATGVIFTSLQDPSLSGGSPSAVIDDVPEADMDIT